MFIKYIFVDISSFVSLLNTLKYYMYINYRNVLHQYEILLILNL